jgi:hypothetical protein
MSNLKKIALASILALSSVAANAEFIKGDWKVVGDNLSVVNTETGLEWLSLTQTDGLSISEVSNLLSTTFSGWRLPTKDEVNAILTSSMGADAVVAGTTTLEITQESLENAITFENALGTTWLGNTRGSYNTHYSYGHYYDDPTDLSSDIYFGGVKYYSDGGIKYESDEPINVNLAAHRVRAEGYTFTHNAYGVYLVSEGGTTLSSINNPEINTVGYGSTSVPLPTTLGLLGLAMAGLSLRRKSA